MIKFQRGNLFEAPVEALVNAVNTVGVMGKGIALQFKQRYPENFRAYARACAQGEVQVGRMYATETANSQGPRWIVNFPTKKHWRQPTNIRWVAEGLSDLREFIQREGVRSIAVPALGCGNGGLEWAAVRPLLEDAFAALQGVEVIVFEPEPTIQPEQS